MIANARRLFGVDSPDVTLISGPQSLVLLTRNPDGWQPWTTGLRALTRGRVPFWAAWEVRTTANRSEWAAEWERITNRICETERVLWLPGRSGRICGSAGQAGMALLAVAVERCKDRCWCLGDPDSPLAACCQRATWATLAGWCDLDPDRELARTVA